MSSIDYTELYSITNAKLHLEIGKKYSGLQYITGLYPQTGSSVGVAKKHISRNVWNDSVGSCVLVFVCVRERDETKSGCMKRERERERRCLTAVLIAERIVKQSSTNCLSVSCGTQRRKLTASNSHVTEPVSHTADCFYPRN